VKILHLDFKPDGADHAQLRYFWDNPNEATSRQLPLSEIAGLMKRSDRDYYSQVPVDYARTGQSLYHWLDGSERHLQRALDQERGKDIVLAIATAKGLAHLPWEILHDGTRFLVQQKIVPVRWVKVGSNKKLTTQDEPKNRALNVLFMASSPKNSDLPELAFEQEEARILEATQRIPLSLQVEESGCLTELGYLVKEHEQGFFDVIHLTGHATSRDKIPCFITETEVGEPVYSSAADIAEAMPFKLPRLMFLSGCRTGYSWTEGTLPSMAEQLLEQGETAVLSWGDRVLDTDATDAAARLYEALATGNSVSEALALAYCALLKRQQMVTPEQRCDWHLLRLYVGHTLPGSLVTSVRKPGRKPAPTYSKSSGFRDEQGKLRVATREDFVGRRRQLQNCLYTLKSDREKVGILLHGMGGLGKSTIASRLWDRLPHYQKLSWWRQIDESSLINGNPSQRVSGLVDKLRTAEQRAALRNLDEELKYRLRDMFVALSDAGEPPLLLVLDDFEWNLEPREGRYVLKPEVAAILSALVWAIEETGCNHRLIITCRYKFQSDLLQSFFVQGLDPFRKSDLKKKLARLEHFSSERVDEGIKARALQLADGNPRLLEFLNDEVLGKADASEQLSQMEKDSQQWQEWKEKIVWPELYAQIDTTLERLLSCCLVFEVPVPMSALKAVCSSVSDAPKQLERALELGLIEVSFQAKQAQRLYRVSRILPRIISRVQLPEAPKRYGLCRAACETLSPLWGTKENRNEEHWQELFRLAFGNRENPQRFREGFHRMLAIQYHEESDRAFEVELRQVKEELTTENLCAQLEEHLQQQQWRKADEETAFIFYQVMVTEGFDGWYGLCKEFPCQALKELDRLWVGYSNGHFGSSVQKQIWRSVGSPTSHGEAWENFGQQVGWYEYGWNNYNTLPFTLDSLRGNLPALCFMHWAKGGWRNVGWQALVVGLGTVGSLLSHNALQSAASKHSSPK